MRFRCASWLAYTGRLICALIVGMAVATRGAIAFGDDFSIGSLAGLQWWASAQNSQLALNPDGSGAVANGGPVGFISDLSGNGHNAIMGNAVISGGDSYRPTLQTDLIGGHSGILFDGSTTFASLQSSLFDGASAMTIALAIEGANGGVYNQYLFGSNSGLLGFQGYGNGYAGVQLANGRTISLPANNAVGVGASTGSDTTIILIARFQPGGESDLWENGQLVASNFPTSPTAVGQFIQSPNAKILGNINYAPAGTSPNAPQSTATRFYFLEGMAATTALSNTQVSQLYNSLSQQWPGIQAVTSSPNLWSGTVTSTDVGHIQGIGIGDGKRFVFHTNMLAEYDANWNLVTYNPSLSTGIVAPGTGFHSGDGDYAQGKIFAPLEQDLAGAGAVIGVYDATKPGLPLIGYKSVASPSHEWSSLTVVPTQGARGVIYATSFEQGIGADKLWMYDYAGGNVNDPSFGSFLGTLQVPSSVTNIQGVAWKAPYFYFSGTQLSRVLYKNGSLDSQAEPLWTAPTTVQGIGFEGSNLYQILQSGSTTEVAWTLTTTRFATPIGAGTGNWNLNSDAGYSSQLGFDGVIPSGAGSTANFAGGTINTINGPAIHVTIDGAYTVGSLNFSPPADTSYILAGDNVPGHGLTLDNGGNGAMVNIAAGNHVISSPLTVADSAGLTFNITPSAAVSITGTIGESGGSRSLALAGGGRLVLSAQNSFTGGTSVNGGLLQTTGNAALGGGPLAINATANSPATVWIGGSETVSRLSAMQSTANAVTIGVGSNARLNVRQTDNTTVPGTLVTAGTFVKSGSGTLELTAAPVILPGGSLQVADDGKLRLNSSTGTASVAAGTVVQVADHGTLELAGSVSTLGSPDSVNRAAIANNSAAAAGLLVTGAGQRVGAIDGSGTTEVDSGSDLTASHIIQGALIIGGMAGEPAMVTIAASDAGGRPLIVGQASNVTQATPSLALLTPFSASQTQISNAPGLSGSQKILVSQLLATNAESPGAFSLGDDGIPGGLGAGLFAVPEPPSIGIFGGLLLLAVVFYPPLRGKRTIL